ncbi:hypothetical protein QFC22_006284 [Naganishia vaughanmartiniae]|uniref:Uncharacterized protein n=1 Tax=Naganishia vaughanmartiniae TaxID=1424756 RepID=A0ACC2WN83_9TREE|nr:hypothetical protein QFC22_006284 [Naganishia vaughanmartiniae]
MPVDNLEAPDSLLCIAQSPSHSSDTKDRERFFCATIDPSVFQSQTTGTTAQDTPSHDSSVPVKQIPDAPHGRALSEWFSIGDLKGQELHAAAAAIFQARHAREKEAGTFRDETYSGKSTDDFSAVKQDDNLDVTPEASGSPGPSQESNSEFHFSYIGHIVPHPQTSTGSANNTRHSKLSKVGHVSFSPENLEEPAAGVVKDGELTVA